MAQQYQPMSDEEVEKHKQEVDQIKQTKEEEDNDE